MLKRTRKFVVGFALIAAIALSAGCSLFPTRVVVNLPGGGDVGEPEPVNLILNGDFAEFDENDKLLVWNVSQRSSSGDVPYPISFEDDAQNGHPALKIFGAGPTGRTLFTQKIIPAKPYHNKRLVLSAWNKSDDVVKGSSAQYFVRVEFWKEGRNEKGETVLVNAGKTRFLEGVVGTADWERLTDTFEVPSEAEEIWIAIALTNTSGTAWWSEVDLREVED